MIDIRTIVKEEMKKYDGTYLPVKANFLEQIFIQKLSTKKLHPNPDDEFCFEDVGPNDEIISKYAQQIAHRREHDMVLFDDPLVIEKIRPDGYMLINGHHRWGAALMMDVEKVPVKLINLTHTSDIIGQMEKTSRNKRASINLDDVVFCQQESEPAEKTLLFPYNRIFPERIRKGMPGLVYALHNAGYDVWIYTSGYASTDYIKQILRHHRIKPDGIINGADRLRSAKKNDLSDVKDLLAGKYRVTLNIDMETVSWILSETKEFEAIEIDTQNGPWANQVIGIVRKLKDL